MRLVLARPRGFCAGVDRAVDTVEELLELYDEPVFVRHEIVHNQAVCSELRHRGAIFVEDVDEVPEGSIVVLSAHGSPPRVYACAKKRELRVFDATCPLVTKVHLEVARYARRGHTVVVIGHHDHVEVRGILGYYDNPDGDGAFVVENETDAWAFKPLRADRVAYVTQTTLAIDQTRAIVEILAARFPKLVSPSRQDICYATQNRQNAVRRLAELCRLIIVIGAPHSSNSVRMVEVARRCGSKSVLIEGHRDISGEWFIGLDAAGLTSSASAPESLIESAIAHIRSLVPEVVVDEIGESESVSFHLPSELRALDAARAGRSSNRRKTAFTINRK
jgi:4-hydroxy-3-methylbut-2-enyl diphosphate reductase